MLRNNRGQTLAIIEIVVVVAIIVILGSILLPRYLGSGKNVSEKGHVPAPKERAESVECSTNLYQVRAAITSYQQTNEGFPASLADLSSLGVTEELTRCPVSHKPYVYDASQGIVSCTTPGHEKY
ncbi:MAG TPA: hypothetical protein VGK34_07515 [Armatimonadota bacterium]|jgi:competence protein ComGC